MKIKTINKKELKKKLDNKDKFKLVNTLGTWQFMAKRIPGSINLDSLEKAEKLLKKDDEIIVYCSHKLCSASQMAYHTLAAKGYKNVRRYAGGIDEWERAGYPLEGEMVDKNEK